MSRNCRYFTLQEQAVNYWHYYYESSEIKHIYPKFNRAQRKSGEAVGLFSYEDQKGIIHLAYNRLKLAPNAIMKYYTVSECRNHIETLCETFELCPKYCHLTNQCF